jgi:hypothetical protein
VCVQYIYIYIYICIYIYIYIYIHIGRGLQGLTSHGDQERDAIAMHIRHSLLHTYTYCTNKHTYSLLHTYSFCTHTHSLTNSLNRLTWRRPRVWARRMPPLRKSWPRSLFSVRSLPARRRISPRKCLAKYSCIHPTNGRASLRKYTYTCACVCACIYFAAYWIIQYKLTQRERQILVFGRHDSGDALSDIVVTVVDSWIIKTA